MQKIVSVTECLQSLLQYQLNTHNGKFFEFPTPFHRWDDLGGIKRGQLHILSAKPSIGATAFALNIVDSLLFGEEPKRILYFTGDLSEIQITIRLLCMKTKYPSEIGDVMQIH